MRKFKVLIVEDGPSMRKTEADIIKEECGNENVEIKDDWDLLPKEAKDSDYEFDLIVLDLGLEFNFEAEEINKYVWKDEANKSRYLGGLYVAEKLIEKKHCKHIYVETSNLAAVANTVKPQNILEQLKSQGRLRIWENTNEEWKQHFKTMVAGAYWAFKNELRINANDVSKVYHSALSKEPLLILGKTGTGKGMFADLLNELRLQNGKNKTPRQPLEETNCAGLKENFLKTELFGHVDGAYTGAVGHRLGSVFSALGISGSLDLPNKNETAQFSFRKGLSGLLGLSSTGMSDENKEKTATRKCNDFTISNEGVLFLDEIGYLEQRDQGQLLQLVDRKIFKVLGYSGLVRVPNLKIVAATSNTNWIKLAKNQITEEHILNSNIPMKLDLFERFGIGNTIFMADLTEPEVREVLGSRTAPEWEEPAVECVCSRFKELRGQRRGLKKLIDAASSYVNMGPNIGIPNNGKVTQEIVELILGPANISGVMNPPLPGSSISANEDQGKKSQAETIIKRNWSKADYLSTERKRFQSGDFDYAVVELLFAKFETGDSASRKEIIECAQTHNKKPKNIDKNVSVVFHRVKEKFNSHSSQSGLKMVSAGGGHYQIMKVQNIHKS